MSDKKFQPSGDSLDFREFSENQIINNIDTSVNNTVNINGKTINVISASNDASNDASHSHSHSHSHDHHHHKCKCKCICLNAEVYLTGRKFINKTQEIDVSTTQSFSTARDTSQLSTYTLFVYNKGSQTTLVCPQVSPDGSNWLDDGLEIEIAPSELTCVVCNDFAHYCRLAVRTLSGTTELILWFQGQV